MSEITARQVRKYLTKIVYDYNLYGKQPELLSPNKLNRDIAIIAKCARWIFDHMPKPGTDSKE